MFKKLQNLWVKLTLGKLVLSTYITNFYSMIRLLLRLGPMWQSKQENHSILLPSMSTGKGKCPPCWCLAKSSTSDFFVLDAPYETSDRCEAVACSARSVPGTVQWLSGSRSSTLQFQFSKPGAFSHVSISISIEGATDPSDRTFLAAWTDGCRVQDCCVFCKVNSRPSWFLLLNEQEHKPKPCNEVSLNLSEVPAGSWSCHQASVGLPAFSVTRTQWNQVKQAATSPWVPPMWFLPRSDASGSDENESGLDASHF